MPITRSRVGWTALLAIVALSLCGGAHAATSIACEDAQNQPQTVSPTNPCPVTVVGGLTATVTAVTKPPAFVGFGTLSVSTSSIDLSTLTVGPGSPAWSMPIAGALYVKNAETSAGNLYICPLGGTCTTSVGIPIGPGASYGFNMGAAVTSPTVIATSTATAVAQW